MSKKAGQVSIDEILQTFQSDPERAFELLILTNFYLSSPNKWQDFITAFFKLDFDSLLIRFPKSVDTFYKVVWLKHFHALTEFYNTEKDKGINKLVSLNPAPQALIKSFFLGLELGENNQQSQTSINYSDESLKAIKSLFKEIFQKLKPEKQSEYNSHLTDLSIYLLRIQIDLFLLDEFLDAYIWADFKLSQKENENGYLLGISDDKTKSENLFILNQLKTFFKRDFKRIESHPEISNEEHFKENDPKWKTDEGLVGVLYGSGIAEIQQDPGLTALKIEDLILRNVSSEDPAVRNAATLEMMKIMFEQNFHYKFRQALSQTYHPNDEIDIHALHLQVEPNLFVSLYELICVMSCFIAKADTFRYVSEMIGSGSIKSIKLFYWDQLSFQHPELSEAEKHNICDRAIMNTLPELEKQFGNKTFQFFTEETLLNWLCNIEELKTRTSRELVSMINLLSSLEGKSPLPFNPLYKIGDQYYFSYTSCLKFDFNRILYDYYISDKLFNPNKKEESEKKLIGNTQKNREIHFTNSVKELFKTLTPFVEAKLTFGDANSNYGFGQLKGDFDVIAYFEKENIIIPIEVKLSNVSPRSEMKKREWVTKRIEKKAIEQINKAVILLQSKPGLKYIAEKLKIGSEIEIRNPKTFPLIVTDNFFSDHLAFQYNEHGDKVRCVSYFELKHLILNQKIHEKQQEWLPFEINSAGSQLMKSIDENIFWNFLNEFANDFSLSKSLTFVTEEFRIEMKV